MSPTSSCYVPYGYLLCPPRVPYMYPMCTWDVTDVYLICTLRVPDSVPSADVWSISHFTKHPPDVHIYVSCTFVYHACGSAHGFRPWIALKYVDVMSEAVPKHSFWAPVRATQLPQIKITSLGKAIMAVTHNFFLRKRISRNGDTSIWSWKSLPNGEYHKISCMICTVIQGK